VFLFSFFFSSSSRISFGRAFSFFGGGESGARACRAIDDLLESSRIDTLLSNFLVPLQVTDA